ncbi:hypothetical protein AKO1_008703, partial [Acrasis kona]
MTHWKYHKKVPMQFTMVDPSSIQSSYKRPPKQTPNGPQQGIMNFQQPLQQKFQFVQNTPQSIAQTTDNVETAIPSHMAHMATQRRNSAPVITFENQTERIIHPKVAQQQSQHLSTLSAPNQQSTTRRSPPNLTNNSNGLVITQHYAPASSQVGPTPVIQPTPVYPSSVRQSRKRSIHDMNEHAQQQLKRNMVGHIKWVDNSILGGPPLEGKEGSEDDYGPDYVSTLTTEQQAYIKGGRSRSVPAHVLSQQLEPFLQQQGFGDPSPHTSPHPSPYPYQNNNMSQQYHHSQSSHNVMNPGLGNMLPSISELHQSIHNNNEDHRRGSIDELSMNFSAHATVEQQGLGSYMMKRSNTNEESENIKDDLSTLQTDDYSLEKALNDEENARRIRRRVSYTEEMNTLELMKHRRGSQPKALDISNYSLKNMQAPYTTHREPIYKPHPLLNPNGNGMAISPNVASPTVNNITSYTFPLKSDNNLGVPMEDESPSSAKSSEGFVLPPFASFDDQKHVSHRQDIITIN